MNGIQPSLYGEMFPTRVRLSGTAIGTQIGFAIGGFAPTAAAAIEGDGPNGWVPVAAYVLVSSLIAAAAVATTKETFKVPLEQLGRRLPLPGRRRPWRRRASARGPASGSAGPRGPLLPFRHPSGGAMGRHGPSPAGRTAHPLPAQRSCSSALLITLAPCRS